jgi:streptogramin lyase
MTRIFISYRRDDCAGHAGRLYDHLVERFGDDGVFMDIDAIEPGADFGERIEKAVEVCSVLIALIGDDWLDIADSGGRRRLDNPADLVRLEIVGALRRRDIRVIPVLVEGATMPATEQLPDDLKPLARRNALELSDARWRYDADRLTEVVERAATAASGPVHGATTAARPGGWRPTPRQRRGGLAAGAAVLVAGVAIILLGTGGGHSGDDTQASRSSSPRPGARGLAPAKVDITRSGVLARPNALTIAAGDVWALSNRDGAVALADAVTGNSNGRLDVGDGASSLAAGFNSVWITKESTSSVLRIDAKTHQRVPGGAIRITHPGRNVAVATGAGAVWVAVRNTLPEDHSPESVVRIDPDSGQQRDIPVERGVQDLAVGAGAVWVTNRFSSTVTRIRPGTGRTDPPVPVGAGPKGIAVGEGAVWVAAAGDDEITRVNPRSLETTSIPLQAIPERVTVGGGSVWVTAKEAGRLIRIDARTRKVLQRIDTASRPYALDVTRGRAVWLTVLDANGLQRVRFHR